MNNCKTCQYEKNCKVWYKGEVSNEPCCEKDRRDKKDRNKRYEKDEY